jgi:electron transfer flavoprotein alpha subunit
MSVLIYAESWEGSFRKSTFEAISYANEVSKLLDTDLVAISFGNESKQELEKLAKYGATKIITSDIIHKGDSEATTEFISKNINNVNVIIFASSYTSKMIAPRLSVKLKAGIASNVIALPTSTEPLQVQRKSFSSKAIEDIEIHSDIAIITLAPNAFEIIENSKNYEIEKVESVKEGNITINGQEVSSGKVSLAEADIIVSAGRGMKGPENWNLIEELADVLSAATACSKPVSDIGWRPHSEHVGQTGKAVAPNLYIAIGISGAIQHLAGVNSSKVMVAINSDAEAPFFKAADYGIVGDAFEIVPKLIEEIKKIK